MKGAAMRSEAETIPPARSAMKACNANGRIRAGAFSGREIGTAPQRPGRQLHTTRRWVTFLSFPASLHRPANTPRWGTMTRSFAYACLMLTGAVTAMAPAHAAPAAAREGSQLVIDFKATINAKSQSDISATTIMHELKGSCRLAAGPLQPFGVLGPTEEQQRAMEKAQPSQGMKDLERKVAACKGNQQCLQGVAMEAAGNPPPEASGGTEGSIQPWFPQSCSGSFRVQDETIVNDPGGEGGGGAYREIRRVTGVNVIPEGGEDGWHGSFIDHDLAKAATSYFFTSAPPMSFTMTSERTGYQAGKKTGPISVSFIETAIPAPFATLKGAPAAGKSVRPVSGGTLTIEWQVRK